MWGVVVSDMVEVRVENVQVKIPSAPIITLHIIRIPQELSCFGTSVIACYLDSGGAREDVRDCT